MSTALSKLWISGLLLCWGCTSKPLDEKESPEPSSQAPSELWTTIYDSPSSRSATALDFNPLRADELWVTLREFPSGLPCTELVFTGCAALEGRVVVIEGASTASPMPSLKKDPNAWHFMRLPSSIAFGTDGLFATCGESRTANFEDDPTPYTGPALWSSDPTIFGEPEVGSQNGKHVDMLHETPFCMGLAHERENVFWAFNGDAGSLDRYDFNMPHEVGGEDHADGELMRYVAGQVLRSEGVPSHMAYDAPSGMLYVADTGNARIARLDTSTGTPGSEVTAYEALAGNANVTGAVLSTFVTAGLTSPSGVTLDDAMVIVTDNATSQILAFDLEGGRLLSFDSGLPAGSLGGIRIGADGKVYVTDLRTGDVLRSKDTLLEIGAL